MIAITTSSSIKVKAGGQFLPAVFFTPTLCCRRRWLSNINEVITLQRTSELTTNTGGWSEE